MGLRISTTLKEIRLEKWLIKLAYKISLQNQKLINACRELDKSPFKLYHHTEEYKRLKLVGYVERIELERLKVQKSDTTIELFECSIKKLTVKERI